MEIFITFIISVLASIVGYYICKWLDGDNTQNAVPSLNGLVPRKQDENPPRAAISWGVRFCVYGISLYHLWLI